MIPANHCQVPYCTIKTCEGLTFIPRGGHLSQAFQLARSDVSLHLGLEYGGAVETRFRAMVFDDR